MKEIGRFIQRSRAINYVLRWAFHPCIRQERVAEHSYWVAMFTAILAPALDRPQLVMAALSHDLDEAITGDCPALVKSRIPEWANLVKLADAELLQASVGAEERELVDMFVDARHAAETSSVVKLADLFSALVYAAEEKKLGNTSFDMIIDELIGSIVKAAEKSSVDAGVAARTFKLLAVLGFDRSRGIERIATMSHL